MDLIEIFEVTPVDLLKLDGISLNNAKERDSPNQFTGAMSTVNNHYYYSNETTPLLQKTIESQLSYLRKLLEEQIGKK